MNHRTFIRLVIVTLGCVGDATAQALPLERGQRIRITAPSLGSVPVAGSFQSIQGDSLVLSTGESTLTLPLQSLTQVEVSQGPRSGAGRGAKLGLLFGGLGGTGTVLALASSGGGEAPCDGSTCVALGAVYIAAFAAVGTLVGVLVGAAVGGGEEWEEVRIDPLSLKVDAQRSGSLSVGLSVRF